MALSSNAARNYALRPKGAERALPTLVEHIYAGEALTSDSNGDVGSLSTSNTFEGFALEEVDNSSGSAGDKNIRVLSWGIIELTVSSIDESNLGDGVYASDDDTFTTTSSGNLQIGKIYQVTDASNNKALVYFEGDAVRSI